LGSGKNFFAFQGFVGLGLKGRVTVKGSSESYGEVFGDFFLLGAVLSPQHWTQLLMMLFIAKQIMQSVGVCSTYSFLSFGIVSLAGIGGMARI
jgi:hypothetical protein